MEQKGIREGRGWQRRVCECLLEHLPSSFRKKAPDDFCPFSPTRHNIPTYVEFCSGVCVCVCVCVCARTRVCSAMSESAAPWTVACQAPLSMEFSRQEHWSELPFPPSGDLPDPGIKSMSPESPALAGRFFTTEPPLCR